MQKKEWLNINRHWWFRLNVSTEMRAERTDRPALWRTGSSISHPLKCWIDLWAHEDCLIPERSGPGKEMSWRCCSTPAMVVSSRTCLQLHRNLCAKGDLWDVGPVTLTKIKQRDAFALLYKPLAQRQTSIEKQASICCNGAAPEHSFQVRLQVCGEQPSLAFFQPSPPCLY